MASTPQATPALAAPTMDPRYVANLRLELVRKRELYQRFGVPEYWYVDLEADRVEVYVLEEGRYPAPAIKYAGEALEPRGLPELSVPVTEALGV